MATKLEPKFQIQPRCGNHKSLSDVQKDAIAEFILEMGNSSQTGNASKTGNSSDVNPVTDEFFVRTLPSNFPVQADG